MKDIFTKLQNFLSDPSSTMALIGAFMVLVSSFFVTPDRFCLVLTSFVAFLAIIAMRTIEVRLMKKLENRNDVIQDLRAELQGLRTESDGIMAACKKKHEDYNELQAKYDERVKDIERLEAALAEERNPKGKETVIGPDLVQEAVRPAKKSGKEYSKKDVQRIQEEMKSAGLVPEKED